MFEKVLIPTDFSSHAKKVIECVGEIPGLCELLLLNVVARDPLARVWDPVAEVKEAEKSLMNEKGSIKTPGVNVRVKAVSVLDGEVASAIQKVAADEKISLVVMGARGRSRIKSALLGSVSRNVLRFGDTHLLIMRYIALDGGEMEKYCTRAFEKVLFPTDFSQPAEAALSFLKGISGIGELMLLNVVSTGETDDEIEANEFAAKEKMQDLVPEIAKSGIKVTSKIIVGHPVEIIRSEAENEDVSLIAMSSVGKDTMYTGRIGSRTYDVANTANRPVLVVRMKPIYAVPVN
jgi:nucleotide-binding universal stress UspA family protein